jgi:hypothetical protein
MQVPDKTRGKVPGALSPVKGISGFSMAPLFTVGLIASAFGLAMFGVLLHWHIRFEKRRAIAAAGGVPAITLVVRSVIAGDGNDPHWPGVWFEDARFQEKPFRESNANWHPQVGDRIPAFRFGPDDYYLPTVDNGRFGSGMAICLTLGLLPSLLFAGFAFRRWQRTGRLI